PHAPGEERASGDPQGAERSRRPPGGVHPAGRGPRPGTDERRRKEGRGCEGEGGEAMSRRVLPMLLIGALLLGALGAGGQEPAKTPDEAPLRLKKKKRPAEPGKAQPDKKEPDKKAADKAKEKEDDRLQPEDDGPGQPDEDEKEILARVGRNMRSAEDQ